MHIKTSPKEIKSGKNAFLSICRVTPFLHLGENDWRLLVFELLIRISASSDAEGQRCREQREKKASEQGSKGAEETFSPAPVLLCSLAQFHSSPAPPLLCQGHHIRNKKSKTNSLEGVKIERFASFPQAVEKIQIHDYFSRNKEKQTNFLRTDSLDERVFQIISGIYEVWNELSYGYLESVYYRALEFELGVERFLFDQEQEFDVFFEGKPIGKQSIASVLNKEIWVCLTSTTKPRNGLERKIRSIVNKTPLRCAILANFSGRKPTIKRIEPETDLKIR